MPVIDQLSGVVLNQNAAPGANDKYALTSRVYQEFFLPSNYCRGAEAGEKRWPALSGFQLALQVPQGSEPSVSFNWTIEYKVFGLPWLVQDSGTTTGVHTYGNRVWANIYFNHTVEVDTTKAAARWRISLTSTSGITVWYTAPNPLSTTSAVARAANGVTALTRPSDSAQFSFMFRILGMTADEGTDLLGNTFRSIVVWQDIGNVNTRDGETKDKYWLSKPNPSRFAVESLYFDLCEPAPTIFDASNNPIPGTELDEPRVIDRILLDPLTPGMFFHVYYSSDGDTPSDEAGWQNKLWTPIHKTFQATKREVHVLPEPVVAKYVKVEFTHLQAKHYSPGDFAQPITYIKHPKWVLDYFLARLAAQQVTEDSLGIRRVGVIFDALDIAYNYYLDDLGQEPDQPVESTLASLAAARTFFANRDDLSDQVDPGVLAQINLSLDAYRQNPAIFAKDTFLPGQTVRQMATGSTTDYPTEQGSVPGTSQFAEIQTLRSESVAFENDFPVTFFYLTCRHAYRVVTADLSHDRAYFAGVNEIAFTRENYATAHDNTQYIEPGLDLQNIQRNDFRSEDGAMVI
jgi:hypothetical protein